MKLLNLNEFSRPFSAFVIFPLNHYLVGRLLVQLVEQMSNVLSSAADLGLAPGLGPLAAHQSLSLSLFPVTLFSCTINKAIKGQKNT